MSNNPQGTRAMSSHLEHPQIWNIRPSPGEQRHEAVDQQLWCTLDAFEGKPGMAIGGGNDGVFFSRGHHTLVN